MVHHVPVVQSQTPNKPVTKCQGKEMNEKLFIKAIELLLIRQKKK